MPPGCHQRNIAEVARKAFKQHFLSILAGLPDDFPWSLWDRLLPQTEVTLNLLRQSNATPNVSAYAHMHGNFDYNRMPLAPIGCPCQVHVKHDNRKSWDFHSQKGYYLFTLGEHYCTNNIFMKDVRAKPLSDTVIFQHPTVPVISHADRIINAITALSILVTRMIPKGARKNKINMINLKCLADVTKRITAQQRDIAAHPSQNELENETNNPNPLSSTKAPPIKHMRRLPRLHESSTDSEGMQKPHKGTQTIKEKADEIFKAFKETVKMTQPKLRVPELDKRTKASIEVKADEIIKGLKEKIEMKQPKTRVSVLDKENIAMKQPEPRVSVTTPHISVLRVQTNGHTEPRVSPSIATRTRAAQTSAKLNAAGQSG